MQCPFCKIDRTKTRVIENRKQVFVALSNPRIMPGHLLVIPKRHVEKLSGLDKNEREELLDTVIHYQEKMVAKYTSGCDIRQHYRPFLKESAIKVNHVHFHLHPRELEDELFEKSQKYERELFDVPSQEEEVWFQKLFQEG